MIKLTIIIVTLFIVTISFSQPHNASLSVENPAFEKYMNTLCSMEHINPYSFSTYPTPANNYITWSIEGRFIEGHIYNDENEEAMTIKSPDQYINISNLPMGSYRLILRNTDGKAFQSEFTKI